MIENVSKVYPTPGSYTVLEDVNLTVSEGEFICVIGHSGCGKSTLLNMVAGSTRPPLARCNLAQANHPARDRIGWWCFRTTPCCLADCFCIYIAVNAIPRSRGRRQRVREHLALVGLGDAADKSRRSPVG